MLLLIIMKMKLVFSIIIVSILIAKNAQSDEYISELPSDYCEHLTKACTCVEQNERGVNLTCQEDVHFNLNYLNYFHIICQNNNLNRTLYDLEQHQPIGKVKTLNVVNCQRNESLTSQALLKSLGMTAADNVNFFNETSTNIVEYNVNWLNKSSKIDFTIYTEGIDAGLFRDYENTTELTLSSDMLRDIPNDIFKVFRNLKQLSWRSGRRCCFRSEAISLLSQLEEIQIIFERHASQLERVCAAFNLHFANATKIIKLTLSNTFEQTISHNIFQGARNLEIIEIVRNKKLTTLPVELFRDQINLAKLVLSDNNIKHLPQNIFTNNKKLKSLDFSRNGLHNVRAQMHILQSSLFKNYLIWRDFFEHLKHIDVEFIELHDGLHPSLWRQPIKAFVCDNDETCALIEGVNGRRCPADCYCYLKRREMRLVVDCADTKLSELPELPVPIVGDLTLFIENNTISKLANISDYGYGNLTELHAADNRLKALSLMQIPRRLKYLDVSNNQLANLEASVLHYLQAQRNGIQLKLAGNPWQCDCTALPLLQFMKNMSASILDFAQLSCKSNFSKALGDLEVADICPSYFVPIVATLSVMLVLIAFTLTVLFFIHKQEIIIWLYEHNLCLAWISKADLDRNKIYDAFVSYCSIDYEAVVELVNKLERGPHRFKLCLHERDWLAGDCIPDRIQQSVAESKRVIIIMSQQYIDSTWARMEFRLAYLAFLADRRKRLIIVKYKAVASYDNVDNELMAYLKCNTYLTWEDENFWRKLCYAMPHRVPVLRGGVPPNDELQIEHRF